MKRKTIFVVAFTSILLALMLISQSKAQTAIPKPSVPQFTLQIINHSLDTPTTYTIDPYTGANITHHGYHYWWQTLDVTIKNQSFTPQNITEGNLWWVTQLLYNIRYKGQYTQNWTMPYGPDSYPIQNSSSEYTVLSFSIAGNPQEPLDILNFPAGVNVEFQVEALEGYVHRSGGPWYPWVFTGETSDWSQTQIITIPWGPSQTSTPSPSPTPSPTLSQTIEPTSSSKPNTGFLGTNLPEEYGYVLVVAVMVVVVLSVAAIAIRRQKKVQV